jgi:hypothetical protein
MPRIGNNYYFHDKARNPNRQACLKKLNFINIFCNRLFAITRVNCTMTRYCIVLFFCLSFFYAHTPLQAQTLEDVKREEACRIVSEQIIPLRKPQFGMAAQWKKIQNRQGADLFADMKPLADGGVVLASQSYLEATENKQSQSQTIKEELPSELVLTRYDGAGKLVWEKRHKIKDLLSVNSVTVVQNRIFVMSTLKGKDAQALRVDFFDGAGTLKISETLADPNFSLTGVDSVSLSSSKNAPPVLMLAVMAQSKKNADDVLTQIWTINEKGEKIRMREYLPGVANRPHSLVRLRDGSVMIVGRVRHQSNRDAGWLMHLDRSGNIITQQAFPRGAQSLLRRAVSLANGDFLIVGDSFPASEKDRAAWIMRITPDFSIVWQQYLTGENSYKAMDVATDTYNRIWVLLSGQGRGQEDAGERSHARLLSYNFSGQILSDQSLREGSQFDALRFLIHQNIPFLSGMTQTGMAEKNAQTQNSLQAKDIYRTYDVYISKLQALLPNNDPCASFHQNQLIKPSDLDAP